MFLNRFSYWMLAIHGDALLDTNVRKWMNLSSILILLFSITEGATWFAISLDLLQNGMQSFSHSSILWISSGLAITISLFVLFLDRSIFMLDLGHLKFNLWANASEKLVKADDTTDNSQETTHNILTNLAKKSTRKILELLIEIPFVCDIIEAFFSIFRLGVLIRLVLVAMTFVASVIGGYTTFGQDYIIQRRFAETLLQEAKQRAQHAPDSSSVKDASQRCKESRDYATAESEGTRGSRKRGIGQNWIRLNAVAKKDCDTEAQQKKEYAAKELEFRHYIDSRENAASELSKTGTISDPKLRAQYDVAKQSNATSYGTRFRAAAEEAANSPLIVAPWNKSDWKSINSPAQIYHFFYLIFFIGVLTIKLLQGVSNAAYYSEELQNAWNNPIIRDSSKVYIPNNGVYTLSFAKWYFSEYLIPHENHELIKNKKRAIQTKASEHQEIIKEAEEQLQELYSAIPQKDPDAALNRDENIKKLKETLKINNIAVTECNAKINALDHHLELLDEISNKRRVFEEKRAAIESEIKAAEDMLNEKKGAFIRAKATYENVTTSNNKRKEEIKTDIRKIESLIEKHQNNPFTHPEEKANQDAYLEKNKADLITLKSELSEIDDISAKEEDKLNTEKAILNTHQEHYQTLKEQLNALITSGK